MLLSKQPLCKNIFMNQSIFKKSECISSSLIDANAHRAKIKALVCVMCLFYYLLGFD